jgi:hypothetical protein
MAVSLSDTQRIINGTRRAIDRSRDAIRRVDRLLAKSAR